MFPQQLTNEAVIEAYQRREEKQARATDVREQIAALRSELDQLECELEAADMVAEIYDGVAIEVTSMSGTAVCAVSDKLPPRAANYYKVAGRSTYGLRLIDDSFGWKGERLTGMDYSLSEAEKLARDWVVHGTPPRS
jgi:hypothetical protein